MRRCNVKKKSFLLEERTKIWHRQIKKIDPLENSFKKMILAFFKKQAKEIKHNILNQKSIKSNVQQIGVIFDFEKWKEELQKDSEPELKEIIEIMATEVMKKFAPGQNIDM